MRRYKTRFHDTTAAGNMRWYVVRGCKVVAGLLPLDKAQAVCAEANRTQRDPDPPPFERML